MTRSEKWAEGTGWGLLAAAAALRVAGAWGSRAVTDMDTSVVALMARHMAHGMDWPVFFYGQGYMGSLEPSGSALLMRLFGDNGFWLAMGPVAFAVAALWALWRWAKAASGPWGGVAALLLGAVGPMVYFAFQFAARGGYMVSLCIDALALWGAAGLAADWWAGKGGGVWRAGALGLLAGLGLWSDPIVVPALGAAGLVLLLGMRGRFWKHWGAVGAGVAGTVAGSSPWWLWWMFHTGNVIALPAGARSPLRVAVELTWQRYLMFQGEGFSRNACLALALAGLALAAAGVAAWAAAAKKRDARSNFATLGAVLFSGAFLAAFVFSGFNQARTGRYWVPAWPALALLGGWACAGWAEAGRKGRWARVAAWGLAGALAAAQTAMASKALAGMLARAPGELERFEGLRQAVAETGADAVMAPRQMYPLNYAWREALPVSDGILHFYGPIRQAAELAENPAYFADWKGSGVLFDRLGLACQRTAHGRVFHHVEPPPQWRVEAWRLDAETPEGRAELPLDPPRAVSRVGFYIHGLDALSGVPMRVDVDVLEGGEWRTVHENAALPAMSWTGTRAYLDGGAYQEFPVASERAEGVRIVARGMLKHRLKRLDLLAYGTDAVAEDTAGDGEAAVRTVLALAGDDAAVFAPRWLANRLHRSGKLEDDRNRGLAPRMFGRIPPEERVAVPAGGAFVAAVERRYAPLAREAFARAGAEAVEAESGEGGAWTCFRADAATLSVPLRWNDRWFSIGE